MINKIMLSETDVEPKAIRKDLINNFSRNLAIGGWGVKPLAKWFVGAV